MAILPFPNTARFVLAACSSVRSKLFPGNTYFRGRNIEKSQRTIITSRNENDYLGRRVVQGDTRILVMLAFLTMIVM